MIALVLASKTINSLSGYLIEELINIAFVALLSVRNNSTILAYNIKSRKNNKTFESVPFCQLIFFDSS